MQIVIDIPEEAYKTICEMYGTFPAEMKKWGLEAIRNGIPLPKGHGQLIDVDALMDALQKLLDERCKDAKFTGNRDASVTWDDAIHCIESAPPIIQVEEKEK